MRLPFKTLLLASAAAATLAAPALAESYFFRTKPLVEAPRAFSFGSESGKNPGNVVESSPVRVSGYRGKTASVTGGEYQVCAAADCAGATWTSAPTANLPPEFHARVRAAAPAYGQTATARLTVGDASAAFEVASRAKDTTPAALDFPPVPSAELNRPAYSQARALSDHDGVTLSVSGGGYQICSTSACTERDGQEIKTQPSSELSAGTLVRLVATPTAFGQPATVTLTAGTATATFTATGRLRDTDPDPVTFASTANATAGQATPSPIVQLTGHDGVTVSASNAQFRVCTTADCSSSTGWLTSSTTAARDTWAQLRATAPTAGTTASPAPALHYGGRTAVWSLASPAALSGACAGKTVRHSGAYPQNLLNNAPNGAEICIGNDYNPSPNANFAVVEKVDAATYRLVATESRSGGRRPIGPFNLVFQSDGLDVLCASIPLDRKASASSFSYTFQPGCSKEAPSNRQHLHIVRNMHDVHVDDQGNILTSATNNEILRW